MVVILHHSLSHSSADFIFFEFGNRRTNEINKMLPAGERFSGQNWQFLAEKRYAGDFRCTATNSIESGADKLTLDVLYGPIVKVKVCRFLETSTFSIASAGWENFLRNWTLPQFVRGPLII